MLLLFIFDAYLHISMFFILLLYLHLISRLPYHVTDTPPWFLRTVKASTSSDSTPTTFDWLFFFIYPRRYGFEWAFFTHRCFLPYAPSQHFWSNLLLSRLPWEPAVIPWNLQGFMLVLEKHRPGPSVCLIHSNPQSFTNLKFVFIHVNIGKVFSFFSSHTIQQPWKYKAAAKLISKHKF